MSKEAAHQPVGILSDSQKYSNVSPRTRRIMQEADFKKTTPIVVSGAGNTVKATQEK
jgi:hypothetical protein